MLLILASLGIAAEPVTKRTAHETRRESEWKIVEIFQKAAVAPGKKVADIGAGNGFLTIPLSSAVGAAGEVFAVDISERALAELKTRVRALDLKNVQIVRGTEKDPLLAANSLHAVIVLRSYHEFTYYAEMLAKIRAALKPGGRLVIADVGPSSRETPREEQLRRHVLDSRIVTRQLAEAGFRVVESPDPFAELSNGERVWLVAAER